MDAPFRPKLPSSCSPLLSMLIERCWDEQQSSRPPFKGIQQYLDKVPGFGRKGNFMQSMMTRMEGYAHELEARMEIATAGMQEEKRKSDELLFQVLPK